MSTYVALGDSYAAGIGSRTPGDRCRRRGGYPVTVAARLGLPLAYQSCESAGVVDVLATQVEALTPETSLVTVTVGGNDAGFAEVVLAAAKPRWLADGLSIIDQARRRTARVLPRLLLGLLDEIAARASAAQVVVTGYPQLFSERDCRWYTFFTPEELAALRTGNDKLTQLILDVAARRDVLLVDVRDRFAGRDMCSDDPWIHHLTWPFADSFHPTAAGHEAYAELVLAALGRGYGPAEPVRVTTGPCRGSGSRIDASTLVRAGRQPPRFPPASPAAVAR